MLLPVGHGMAIPVQLILPLADGPVLLRARATRHEEGLVEVEVEGDPGVLEPGVRVILDSRNPAGTRLFARVQEVDGRRATLAVAGESRPDQRRAPRFYGGVKLRYRVLSAQGGAERAKAWLKGLELVEDGWHEPDPFMDFSAFGLRFEDLPTCEAGDRLLLAFQVPGAESWYRALARVVRVEPMSPEERQDAARGATHTIAVELVEVSQDAAESLAQFTIRLQKALMS